VIVDPFTVPEFDKLPRPGPTPAQHKADMTRWISMHPGVPYPSVKAIADTKLLHPLHQVAGEAAAAAGPVDSDKDTLASLENDKKFLAAFTKAWPTLSPATRQAALSAWMSREPWAFDLVQRIERQELPASAVDTTQRGRLLKHESKRISQLAAKVFASTSSARTKVIENYRPALALKGDPNEDPPHKWEYEAVLPIRGTAKLDDGTTLTRVQGGMHILALTVRGLVDLPNVYVYLFGKFLPSKKQQLMRPYLLHQVLDGRGQGARTRAHRAGRNAARRTSAALAQGTG
jgi:DNA gyrase inhibitor GyrI